MLSTSDGRDKFLSIFQYLADFYHSCAKYSNIPDIKKRFNKNSLPSIRFAENLNKSLSSARKTFRLLKFFNELKDLRRIIYNKKPLSFKLLMLLETSLATIYYLADNTLFCI